MQEKEDLVPLDQVLYDMSMDKGYVSRAARDYYKIHYATELERKQMDREDTICAIIGAIILITPILIILFNLPKILSH